MRWVGHCCLSAAALVMALILPVTSAPAQSDDDQPSRPRISRGDRAPLTKFSWSTLSEQERKLDCANLKAVVVDYVDQIKKAQALARKEQNAPAPDLVSMFQRATGPAGSGLKALDDVPGLRAHANALIAHYAAKGCGQIDLAALSKPALAPVVANDRCQSRTELELEDCVEDIAQWRCRTVAGKGRAYLECLEQVAERAIKASGFQKTRLLHYEPECSDRFYGVASCAVFTSNRVRSGTQRCHRVDDATIEVCTVSDKPVSAAAPSRTAGSLLQKSARKGADASPGPVSQAAAPAPSSCHKVACAPGACRRLCDPPPAVPVAGFDAASSLGIPSAAQSRFVRQPTAK